MGLSCKPNCPYGSSSTGETCLQPTDSVSRAGDAKAMICPEKIYDEETGGEIELVQRAALCYAKCADGYKDDGWSFECEGPCPEDSNNTGLTCLQSTDAYSRSPVFKICPEGLEDVAGLCYPPCKEGYVAANEEEGRLSDAESALTCISPCSKF